jgi:hypothetical protein
MFQEKTPLLGKWQTLNRETYLIVVWTNYFQDLSLIQLGEGSGEVISPATDTPQNTAS